MLALVLLACTPKPPEITAPAMTLGGLPGRVLEAGTFTMGCTPGQEADCFEYEFPAHPVTLTRPIWVAETELTQAQWSAVMDSNPSQFQVPDHPVEQVSWREALSLANRISEREGLEPCYVLEGMKAEWPQGLDCEGFRLATEAEWEYAARAGFTHPFAGGKELEALGWYGETGDRLHPAGGAGAQRLGSLRHERNVFEWVWDGYQDYAEGPQEDPVGPGGRAPGLPRGQLGQPGADRSGLGAAAPDRRGPAQHPGAAAGEDPAEGERGARQRVSGESLRTEAGSPAPPAAQRFPLMLTLPPIWSTPMASRRASASERGRTGLSVMERFLPRVSSPWRASRRCREALSSRIREPPMKRQASRPSRSSRRSLWRTSGAPPTVVRLSRPRKLGTSLGREGAADGGEALQTAEVLHAVIVAQPEGSPDGGETLQTAEAGDIVGPDRSADGGEALQAAEAASIGSLGDAPLAPDLPELVQAAEAAEAVQAAPLPVPSDAREAL